MQQYPPKSYSKHSFTEHESRWVPEDDGRYAVQVYCYYTMISSPPFFVEAAVSNDLDDILEIAGNYQDQKGYLVNIYSGQELVVNAS